jgi:putative transposase
MVKCSCDYAYECDFDVRSKGAAEVMGRKRREEAAGFVYHVIARGHNKSYIFQNRSDKEEFLRLLGEMLTQYHIILHYYAIMDNHYHLILERGDIPLSKAMQFLHQSYSRYYNNRYHHNGTIFDGRYTALIISDDTYYYQLLRYIAYNPVVAGIVRYPGEYRWAAHREFLARHSELITISKVLSRFSSNDITALGRYRTLIESDSPVLETDEISRITLRVLHPPKEYLQYVFDEMELSSLDTARFFSAYRGRKTVAHRKEFIIRAITAGHTLTDIAEFLPISYESVRRGASLRTHITHKT